MIGIFLVILISSAQRSPKYYDINMNLPAETRYIQLHNDFSSEIKSFAEFYAKKMPVVGIKSLIELLNKGYLTKELIEEYKALAKNTNITYEQAVFLNFMYEWHVGCTSIVVKLANGTVIHGRNLDYLEHSFFANTAVEVRVFRGSSYLFTSIGFAWNTGVVTALSPNYSLSLNQRNIGGPQATYEALTKGHIGNLQVLRQILLTPMPYNSALYEMQHSTAAATAYYIIGGVSDGAVLTMDRYKTASTQKLDENIWFIVQTNTDHWLPDPDNRRNGAISKLESIGQEKMTIEQLYDIMASLPNKISRTIFTNIMIPSVGYLKTYVYDN